MRSVRKIPVKNICDCRSSYIPGEKVYVCVGTIIKLVQTMTSMFICVVPEWNASSLLRQLFTATNKYCVVGLHIEAFFVLIARVHFTQRYSNKGNPHNNPN